MRRIKRVHATAVIVLLLAILSVMQIIDHREALRCYVSQQAAKYQQAQGFATADEIHDIVWDYTVADLDGQLWRARLDDLFHDIFMGGRRGEQVWAEMKNPADEFSDVHCFGYIEWVIWNNREDMMFRTIDSGEGMEAVHNVTFTLQTILSGGLQYYTVKAMDISFQSSWDESGGSALIYHRRPLGEVSAKDWLNGEIAPAAWAGWYARWQERWQELQENEGE